MAMRTSSVFQPTLPLRGATHEHGPGGQPQPASTHAPLAGSDVPRVELFRDLRVSTHAPLAGSDMPITSAAQPSPFCFNPRSPCGERRARRERRHLRGPVSTHAPLAGSDERGSLRLMRLVQFQPTLPLRGATRASRHRSPHPQCFNPRSPCGERPDELQRCGLVGQVSTHAPLAGSDMKLGDTPSLFLAFQPTLPLRGATFLTAIRNAPSRSFNDS